MFTLKAVACVEEESPSSRDGRSTKSDTDSDIGYAAQELQTAEEDAFLS